MPFHVQSTAAALRDGFPVFAHHESVSALWSQKWHQPCAAGIYPFGDGQLEDFEPIFAELRAVSGDDPGILYRPDDYAAPFLPVGDRLTLAAQEAAKQSSTEQARELFLRAAAVYRMARVPIVRSPLGRQAWEKGKAAYERGTELLDPPNIPVAIPFRHADIAAGDRVDDIPAYLRVPGGPRPTAGWPVLLYICGLDGYRTDQTAAIQAHVNRGLATLTFEIPGTGDCPAAPNDPTSDGRLISSILDWIVASAPEFGFDPGTILARGVSTGGYHAVRIAHTHADRLFAVVAHGGGYHHMFDADWISAQNQMEFPFALADALAHKFGYRDPDPAKAVAAYAAEAHRFSLADSGVLASPACRLLVINGVEDSIFPIEDSILAGTRGDGTDLIVLGGRAHMGEPAAESAIHAWIEKALATRA
ncbi:alpha/beta hydrolase [Catenulispora sp. NF23]|uniref:alpha/beta hydrolase family protein n=1 Tax=Catenulispora pinistramenti TaxID=2705254 RepID=UPI001BA80EFD|nr:alpha/beta hydrolase [Catenulispora pinistramenti]MBS2533344.1 alpha/beta hydrolase [Catenulispora pinistramenti]